MKNAQGKTETPRLLSLADTAKHYGLKVWFWRQRIYRREIPHVKIGGKYYFDAKDIDAFIEANKSN